MGRPYDTDRIPRNSDACPPSVVVGLHHGQMVKYLLTAAAVYLGAIGLALVIVPAQFGVDAVPPDPSSELLALLRLLGGPLLGIAVLNWLTRKAASSPVLLANLVGFGIVAANDVVGVVTGDARDLARVFVVVHLAFTAAFAVAWSRQTKG
ncbi:hypothetical protein GCM10009742_24570 [Kribbella karoonensis]|uniref:DUF4267 domain-containing protein n=2 Tax=Kribbellaceae TaxID=2726069 RepID=A0ABN2DKW1_9ACTN